MRQDVSVEVTVGGQASHDGGWTRRGGGGGRIGQILSAF